MRPDAARRSEKPTRTPGVRTWVDRFDTAPGPHHRDQGLLAQSTAVTSPRWSTPINARTTQFLAWITHVATDMAAEYAKAVRHASPHAQIVVDHLHVVKLANQRIDDVRRRTTQALRGRRGRACDPEWTSHRRLLSGVERLTDPQRQKMFNNRPSTPTVISSPHGSPKS